MIQLLNGLTGDELLRDLRLHNYAKVFEGEGLVATISNRPYASTMECIQVSTEKGQRHLRLWYPRISQMELTLNEFIAVNLTETLGSLIAEQKAAEQNIENVRRFQASFQENLESVP